MGHYKSNVRDLEFNLFEVFNVQERLGKGVLAESDEDTARGVLAELNRLATGPLAESFADADRNPPTYDPKTFSAKLPESFKKAYQLMWDGDWWRLGLADDLGGLGLPPTVQWAAAELMLGANPPLFMYMSGPNMAQVLHHNGTDEQQRWAQLMIDRGWGATMVLTEPDAGSDVGAGRTKAVQQEDGSWHIDGVKRFITSGEHDLTENIIHLVLARPEGGGPGHQGPVDVRRAEVPVRQPRPASWASATAPSSPTSSTRWASRRPRRASCRSASTARPPRAGWSATCTTASRRCSRSSSTPG